jgi:tetratricopeptide (TPR) repeat protein/predicted Ser/Thr protein kinase
MDAGYERVKEIFLLTCELDDAGRVAVLERECGGDGRLRREVEQLLAHDDEATTVAGPGPEAETKPVPRESTLPLTPGFIPGYELIREIHRGGQGVVYLAHQAATRRQVALKVMREGPFSRPHEQERFEREVLILGRLDHPNIVTIHDSGKAAGFFYYVMDYIAGGTLDRWARSEKRSIEDMLRLFAKVCDAVSVAHRHGVVHRDLKPGNIRVDPEGEPKVLDFGIAKVSGAGLTADGFSPAVTMTGQFVGTLPWAAPEQAAGRPADIGTGSDVYSLGVILYWLLTDRFPYDVEGSVRDVINRIAEAPPVRPRSARAAIGADVETIILKAIAKETAGRYPTAAELAADVDRYLGDLPILARQPTVVHRARLFIRRNSLQVGAAAVVVLLFALAAVGGWLSLVLALVLGLVGTGWQFLLATRAKSEATRQRDEAVAARQASDVERSRALVAERLSQERRREAEAARQEAEVAARRARAINDFLVEDMLASCHPAEVQGRDVTVREVLDNAARQVDAAFYGEPELESAIRDTIAAAYRSLGRNAEAEEHLRATLRIRKRLYDEDHPEHATTLNNLARVLYERGEFEEAEPLYREALGIRRRTLGHDHPHVAPILGNLASLLRATGAHDEAEAMCREVVAVSVRAYGRDHPTVATGLTKLAKLLEARRRYGEAERLYREAVRTQRGSLGGDHLHLAYSLNHLSNLLQRKGDHDAAEPIIREALRILRARLGDGHRHVLVALNNLGRVLMTRGDFAGAAEAFGEAARSSARLGPRSVRAAAMYEADQGACLARTSRFEEAEEHLRAAHAALTAEVKPDPDVLQRVVRRLVSLYEAWGRPDEAARYRGPGPVGLDAREAT